VNGVGTAASFNQPHGIACDLMGNVYVGDDSNHRIRKIVLSSATVTTLAGSGTASSANGVGTNAGFNRPVNVVVDPSGTLLFVVEYSNRVVRQIVIATQTVTTLAGSGASGSANGVGIAAQFNGPHGMAIDAFGNLFVVDIGSHLIRKIVIATQAVTTVAGSGAASWADGVGTNAAFNSPIGLAVDARGNILVAESSNQRVRLLQPSVSCPSGYYCPSGADRVVCASCAAGSSAPPGASITRTTSVWTVGENGAGVVNFKCVNNALGVSASLAFSAMSVRVSRGVFMAASYATSSVPSGNQQGTWLYQGCFADNPARLLPFQLATSLGPTDAALSCLALGRAAGFSVVGMEAWGPPNGECWGLPPTTLSNWRTTGVNEGNCGEGDGRLPAGLRWGTAPWAIAIYQFNLPVQPVYAQKYGIMSPGYLTSFPGDHFTWDIVMFPTPTTASVCATSFNRGNGWGDSTLKGLFLV
jgi:sugar lactone lactonase YvrE